MRKGVEFLDDNEHVFRELFQTASDAMILVEQGIIRRINPSAEQLFGYKPDEIIRSKVEKLMPKNFQKSHVGHRETYESNPQGREMGIGLRLRAVKKNGMEFPVEISLTPLNSIKKGLVAVAVRDISLRTNLEEKVKSLEFEQEFFRFLDLIMEGAQVIDKEWRYLYVNKAVVDHGKSSEEELLGRTMMEAYPGIEETELFKTLQSSMLNQEVRYMINKFDFPDGTHGFFELRIQPIPQGVFILSIDITDKVKAEDELKDQNRILQSKNQELEQMTYITSHDLQEPLRTISNYITLLGLELEGIGNEKVLTYLSHIQYSSERLRNLVEGLLEYSILGKNKMPQIVNSQVLVEQVLEDIDHLIKENSALVELDKLPERIWGYYEELESLFLNLIVNAIKFKSNDRAPVVRITCEDTEFCWMFKVEDNGLGIEVEHQQRIFNIFQRLHPINKYEGYGMGLAQCKKIVELHSGEIWVKSEIGRGSEFLFTIKKTTSHEQT